MKADRQTGTTDLCSLSVPVFTAPPKAGEDPFETKTLPEDLTNKAGMRDGVVHVEGMNLPTSDLATFIDDMNFLIALIAQGPTYVFSHNLNTLFRRTKRFSEGLSLCMEIHVGLKSMPRLVRTSM